MFLLTLQSEVFSIKSFQALPVVLLDCYCDGGYCLGLGLLRSDLGLPI